MRSFLDANFLTLTEYLEHVTEARQEYISFFRIHIPHDESDII